MTDERFSYLKREWPEIIARAMWHQAQQGRTMTYDTTIDSRNYGCGFSWGITSEGIRFWSNVFNDKNIPENVVKEYKRGDIIKVRFKNTIKNFIFLNWDLEHKAIWTMTETAWLLVNSRTPSETLHADIRKMPLQNLVWDLDLRH